jgi:sulfonate transport system ATP-binding protein
MAVPTTVRTAVRITGLTKTFGDRRVIDGLDLTVRSGEFVAPLGRSRCAKSTLLRILAGLDADIDGEVTVPRKRAVAFGPRG